MNIKSFFTPIFTAVLAVSLFTACKDEAFEASNAPSIMKSPKGNEYLKDSEMDNYFYKKKFAVALHAAMYESKELRNFIKHEALKRFDCDYDVLYNYVKDNAVEGTGKTLRELLTPYFKESGVSLDEIARQVPLLTIFVPALPENSFSAESWDVEKYVPLVAVRLRGCSEVPIFTRNDTVAFKLKGNIIPGFPVVVVKDNERVILPDNPKFKRLTSQKETFNFYDDEGYLRTATAEPIIYNSGSNDFPFLIPIAFDIKRIEFSRAFINDMAVRYSPEYWEKKAGGKEVEEAWDLIGSSDWNDTIWQRDYIYYGINRQNHAGRYMTKYSETLTDFKIEGTGINAWSRISSIGGGDLFDPLIKVGEWEFPETQINAGYNVSATDFWTEGDFEFGVKIVMPNKTDAAAGITQTPLQKWFPAMPSDLFNLKFESHGMREVVVGYKTNPWTWVAVALTGPFGFLVPSVPITENYYFYEVTDIQPKKYHLKKPISVDVPWRLEEYSTTILIGIEETDYTVELGGSFSEGVKFNTNFTNNYENTSGSSKVGGSTGSSSELTYNVTGSYKYTENSDQLGEARVHFGHSVIMGQGNDNYIFKGYNLGHATIVFRPCEPIPF
ncbi:MAG: hypothetical protein LBB53_03550 [Prevotellaceae bacterium]|jgi:hypothetical protein|nr:hypothetical protein [Prevotellaceae bacterium]